MIAVLSEEISCDFEKATGIKSYPLKKFNKLPIPVASHADMLLCVIENTVFCYKDYFYENPSAFKAIENSGYTIVKVEHECANAYPNDIGLNVLIMGKTIFCKTKYTAKEIIAFANKYGYKIVNVNQGYSCCSTFVVNDNLAITADFGMKKAIEEQNKSVIFINGENIKLDGYNCGFVGGCGAIYGNKAYFFGDISKGKEYEKIIVALKNEKIEIFSIIMEHVCDFGGIKFF